MSIALTTRTVKNAYWDYVYSINSLQVSRQSLDLAQESLRNTRSRVEIGTLVLNVLAVLWIMLSKRLFGLRGGAVAFEAEKHSASLLEVETAAGAVPGAAPAPAV